MIVKRSVMPVVVAVLVAGPACAGDGTGPGNGGNGGPPTLSATIQPILTANCAVSGCHAGPTPQLGMNLSAGQTLSNTVNVAANQTGATSMLVRISPSQPDLSYLVHKIQGTHLDAGVDGQGQRMPLGQPALSAGQINSIRAWISAGALNN